MIVKKSPNTPKSWTFFSNLEVWSENVHVLLQVFCIYTSLRMTKVLASVRQRWKNTHICSQTLQRDEVTVSDNPKDCWKNFITADLNSNDIEKGFCRTGCCCWNLIHHQHIRSSTRISEPLKVNNWRGDEASRHLLPSKEYSWDPKANRTRFSKEIVQLWLWNKKHWNLWGWYNHTIRGRDSRAFTKDVPRAKPEGHPEDSVCKTRLALVRLAHYLHPAQISMRRL